MASSPGETSEIAARRGSLSLVPLAVEKHWSGLVTTETPKCTMAGSANKDIRTAMIEARRLFEMPYLSDTGLDFGLATPEGNASRLADLMAKSPEIVSDYGEDVLYHVGTRDLGAYFLVYAHKRIEYFVEHEAQSIGPLGPFVTQIKLWRTTGMHFQGGITDIVFAMLLREYGTVVSDEAQTKRGRDFWLRQMAKAVQNGFEVGLIDEKGKLEAFRDFDTYSDWIIEAQHTAWGQDFVHMKRRFFIRSI